MTISETSTIIVAKATNIVATDINGQLYLHFSLVQYLIPKYMKSFPLLLIAEHS